MNLAAGMQVEILQIYQGGTEFAAPVTLIEKQRDGSKGWSHWLVENEQGKKKVQWISPGSRVLEPALVEDEVVFEPAPLPSRNGSAKKTTASPSRLARHKPILPSPAEQSAVHIDALANILVRLESAITSLAASQKIQARQLSELHSLGPWGCEE